MKEKIFNYLCSYPEINELLNETMYKSPCKKVGKRVKNIPYMVKVICANRSSRRKKYYAMKSDGDVFHITRYDDEILMYLPYISYRDGMIAGDLIQRYIFLKNDFYEADELHYLQKKYLRDVSNMLDIGANIGNHTVYYSKIAKFKKIFSFEPVKETYSILKRNVEINELEGVTIYNLGLGEKESSADILFEKTDNCGATQLEYKDDGKLKIIALNQMEFDCHIDFIKIDVEGFEKGVLKGASKIILEDKPIIFIEIFPENYDSIVEIMKGYNYYLAETIGKDNYIFLSK